MRVGVLFQPCANAYYRAVDPARALAARDHDVVLPDESGDLTLAQLSSCDVVHVYRRSDEQTLRKLTELRRSHDVPIVYDNDDDLAAVPPGTETHRRQGGLRGQRYFAMTVKVGRLAEVVTTTTEPLAERYRAAGLERVEVVPNMLSPNLARPSNRQAGVVVGWIAGIEHTADLERIPLVDALRRLVAEHPDVHVETVGVDLRLPERYVCRGIVQFLELPRHIARYDIGLAPLADLPFNRMRSDIKLKEYAASGVPWLASPVGPYAELGPDQGGRLVADDEWYDALDRLVTHKRDRRKLARKGKSWAKRQTIDATAERWERVLERVVERKAPSVVD